MLQHLIFFFKQFSQRGPLGTSRKRFLITRTSRTQFVRK
jgi:hypothetical protein